mgnify:FL=1
MQKDKILISTKVSVRSKTTQTIKKYTKVETKSVKTQTNIALSTPIEFNAPLIQSPLSTASDSTKPEIQWAVKAIKSHEVEAEKDQPTCKITGVHCVNEVDNEDDHSESNTESSDEEINNDPLWNSDEYYKQDEVTESSKNSEEYVMLSCNKSPEKQLKLIIFEEALANVFSTCYHCGSECLVFYEQAIGTYCKIRVSCKFESTHQFSWPTGPLLHHMPILHLLLSSSILCGGLQPSTVLRLFESVNIPCIKRREFCNLQSAYVIPAVYNVWKKNQEEDFHGKKVVVASDMRVDSPGHSGLLGSGSTLDVDRNLVLDTQIVQVCRFISCDSS